MLPKSMAVDCFPHLAEITGNSSVIPVGRCALVGPCFGGSPRLFWEWTVNGSRPQERWPRRRGKHTIKAIQEKSWTPHSVLFLLRNTWAATIPFWYLSRMLQFTENESSVSQKQRNQIWVSAFSTTVFSFSTLPQLTGECCNCSEYFLPVRKRPCALLVRLKTCGLILQYFYIKPGSRVQSDVSSAKFIHVTFFLYCFHDTNWITVSII